MSYPEEQLASQNVIGEPKQYADEPAPTAAPAPTPAPTAVPAPKPAPVPAVVPVPVAKAPVRVSFEAEPLFSFDKSLIRGDQRASSTHLSPA